MPDIDVLRRARDEQFQHIEQQAARIAELEAQLLASEHEKQDAVYFRLQQRAERAEARIAELEAERDRLRAENEKLCLELDEWEVLHRCDCCFGHSEDVEVIDGAVQCAVCTKLANVEAELDRLREAMRDCISIHNAYAAEPAPVYVVAMTTSIDGLRAALGGG